jgi:hypothetical protein
MSTTVGYRRIEKKSSDVGIICYKRETCIVNVGEVVLKLII